MVVLINFGDLVVYKEQQSNTTKIGISTSERTVQIN